jgi:uncharacterized protein YoaH (UPF0181 family)
MLDPVGSGAQSATGDEPFCRDGQPNIPGIAYDAVLVERERRPRDVGGGEVTMNYDPQAVTVDRRARLMLSGKSAGQKLAAVAQALGVDAVADAR